MRRTAVLLIMLLVTVPASALAGNVTTFEDGKTEAVAWLRGPTYTEYINLSLPADCIIGNATLDVSSVLADINCSTYPEGVQLFLNGTLLWEFNGNDYGALGWQDAFLGNVKQWKMGFEPNGGNKSYPLRIMKNAQIKNATMEIDCTGPGWFNQLNKFIGEYQFDEFGYAVANAGDVNKDGYDDIVVGSPQNFTTGSAGRAYIFFGGTEINTTPDINLTGEAAFDCFGCSVSGAGDVNGDGFDDVIVGTTCSWWWPYQDTCKAYLYYGGAEMDAIPDVVFNGERNTSFGISVSGAGDVNKDGYDDVIVGANNSANASGIGRAHIYYGAANMDNITDILITGANGGDGFGHEVSDAGDVNKDGYDDVIVGACARKLPDFKWSGAGAYLIYGGPHMNATPDVNLNGNGSGDIFGRSVSGAGDVNGDGYGDVIVGATCTDMVSWSCDQPSTGRALIYYGEANMDGNADVILKGANAWDAFGHSVSDAGDVNKDGYDDVIVGAPYNNSTVGKFSGVANIYYGQASMDNNTDAFFLGEYPTDLFGVSVSGAGDVNRDGYDEVVIGSILMTDQNDGTYCKIFSQGGDGIDRPSIAIGKNEIWKPSGFFNGTERDQSFAAALNSYLSSNNPTDIDEYGNAYVDVPVKVSAKGAGNITLSNLNITYTYETPIFDFSVLLKQYIAAHMKEKDGTGNVTIPIKVVSRTPGRVELLDLKIGLDEAPTLLRNIPDVTLAEDSASTDLLDLRAYFEDDYDPVNELRFCVTAVTNASFVNVSVFDDQYLSADAKDWPLSANWTGELKVVARCIDSKNHSRDSNEFRIIVYNMNDPPFIASSPPTNAKAGETYLYQAVAVDGDNDPISFSLAKKAQNMTVNPGSGLVEWIPPAGGFYEVKLTVSDGQSNSSQSFVITVPYRPPRVTNTTIPEAQTGVPYAYDIPVVSDDGRELAFKLLGSIPAMTINSSSGRLGWTPKDIGDFPVSVNISDSKTSLLYNFTIHVVKGNNVPIFSSEPVKYATLGLEYSYQVVASDEDGDSLVFSLDSAPPGMTIGFSSGRISWMPNAAGKFTVKVKVSDGKGAEAIQEFTITVTEGGGRALTFTTPLEGQKVKGTLMVSGTAVKWASDIVKVQVKVDSGGWKDAKGNYSWQVTIDTAKLSNGKHVLYARAYDGTSYSETINRTVIVENKAGGGGFIPGLEAALAVPAFLAALFFFLRRRENHHC